MMPILRADFVLFARKFTSLVTTVMILGLTAPAHAQDGAAAQAGDQATAMITQESDFQAWRLTCVAGAPATAARPPAAQAGCSISTRFDLQQQQDGNTVQKNTLLVLSVARAPDGQGHIAVFSLPLGVYLPSGLAMVFDGQQSLRLAFETCNETGCHAGLRLTEQFEDLFGSTERLEILFNNQDQQTLKLPLYLAGFEQARHALATATAGEAAAS